MRRGSGEEARDARPGVLYTMAVFEAYDEARVRACQPRAYCRLFCKVRTSYVRTVHALTSVRTALQHVGLASCCLVEEEIINGFGHTLPVNTCRGAFETKTLDDKRWWRKKNMREVKATCLLIQTR